MRFDISTSALRRLKPVLPVVSFLWAVFSGIRIARDFSHGWRLLVFAGGVWFVLFVFSLWIDFLERTTLRQRELQGLYKYLAKRRKMVEWLALAVAQFQVQYVFFFSIPFLFWSKSWLIFCVAVATAFSTLWDPWWEKLIRFPAYQGFVRSFSLVLATSFSFAILLPAVAPFVSFFAVAIGIVAAVPWREVRCHGFLQTFSLHRFSLPFPVGFWVVLFLSFLSGGKGFPLLSVWVSNQASFGFEVEKRNLVSPISDSLQRSVLQENLRLGKRICCWTPIVAPHSLQSNLEHVWTENGVRVLDTIRIGEVVGLDKDRSFRTFSCKTVIENVSELRELSCRVRIAGILDIGGVALTLY